MNKIVIGPGRWEVIHQEGLTAEARVQDRIARALEYLAAAASIQTDIMMQQHNALIDQKTGAASLKGKT